MQQNFIVYTENFDCWRSITLVDSDDLATISVAAPFHNSATKLFCLAILKFWIEDKIRMNEPHLARPFRKNIPWYFQLYLIFIAAKPNYDHVAHVPKFSLDDLNGFKIRTKDYLGLIQGSGGVPLSYIIRDDVVCPVITTDSSRNIKIH